jgi:hypothetical protein
VPAKKKMISPTRKSLRWLCLVALFVLGASAAHAQRVHVEQRSIAFQIEAANPSNRVNVINFASLFSGTGVAPPRSISAHLKLTF